jgi:hypothetical protein
MIRHLHSQSSKERLLLGILKVESVYSCSVYSSLLTKARLDGAAVSEHYCTFGLCLKLTMIRMLGCLQIN